jgi:hypothetical protein
VGAKSQEPSTVGATQASDAANPIGLIERKLRIEFNSVILQESGEFGFEIDLLVMGLLVLNVSNDGRNH